MAIASIFRLVFSVEAGRCPFSVFIKQRENKSNFAYATIVSGSYTPYSSPVARPESLYSQTGIRDVEAPLRCQSAAKMQNKTYTFPKCLFAYAELILKKNSKDTHFLQRKITTLPHSTRATTILTCTFWQSLQLFSCIPVNRSGGPYSLTNHGKEIYSHSFQK